MLKPSLFAFLRSGAGLAQRADPTNPPLALDVRPDWRPKPPVCAAPAAPRPRARALRSARLELAVASDRRSKPRGRVLRDAAQALAAMGTVVAFGLLWSLAEARVVAHTPPAERSFSDEGSPVSLPPNEITRTLAPDGVPEPPLAEAGLTWLIDGFNLLHAGLLGAEERGGEWWKEALRERVVDAVARVVPTLRADGVWVVFDGPHGIAGADDAREPVASREVDDCPPLQWTFAECADDWILARVRHAAAPERLAAVTADRRLANRLRHRGAQVVAPREFLAAATPVEEHDPLA